MLGEKLTKLTSYQPFFAMILATAAMLSLGKTAAQAETLDAEFVLNKLTAEQRGSYLAGVVEGLAFSRFLQDRPDESGMTCIYDWQSSNLADAGKLEQVHAWLARHSDKTVGVLLYTLIKKDCGE